MKIIVTIIPTNCNNNCYNDNNNNNCNDNSYKLSYESLISFFVETKNKKQIFSKLIIDKYFCF